MTKPQSPRSRPAGAARAASEGRDGRSFFSRPKGDARAPIARDSARDDRSGGSRDERSGGRPTPRPSYDAPRGEGRGGERGAYGADRREGRPSPRPSFDPTRGEGRGERASYGSERHEGRPGPRPSYDASRGEGRGGERGSYGSERREGRPGPRPSYDAPRGEGRGGERASYGSERREGRQDARPSHGSPRGGERGQYAGPRGGEGGHGQGYGGQDRPPKPQFNRPRLSHAAIRIDQVQRVLGEILQWTYPADAALSHWLRNHPNLGARDRSEVAEAVYDVLRHLRRYRQFGESGVGPASRRLAILGLAATLGANELAEGMDAAEAEWLQRVSQIDLATLPRAVRGSIPDWLDERLGAMDSPDTLIEALNRQASLDLRVNPLKVERDAMLAELQQGAGRYEPVAMRYSPWGIRMEGRPAINRWPQFENGSIEVQDEGSQLLALLVGPRRGEMIIDFCAGAGGKTLLLGALMRSTGRLYAFDVSAARLARAKPRFARSGLSNVVPVVIDSENDARVKRLAGKAQRVLVDAPCSGIGTLRRNPDLKWRQHPEALAELGQLQERILNSAARCVAPGGRLVYATCSLLAEENEVQAERFLASHPDFERLDAAEILAARCENLKLDGPYVQLRPDVHGTDGFFAAVFERRKKGVAAGADDAQAAETSEVAPQEPAGETPAGDQDQPA
ncbi:Ribosomal RNA small subunit methyltransferase B [Achromobacter insolitus]|nr:RsmB/NOP family class I SAM-dependent RNA methyltransferase [Achromobacter insolitus]CAB3955289.1 Ribosomal RNA small subunit methyltransferase B [Achromobacter insolitus]